MPLTKTSAENVEWRSVVNDQETKEQSPEVAVLSFIREMADVDLEEKLFRYKKYLERYFQEKSRDQDVGFIFYKPIFSSQIFISAFV